MTEVNGISPCSSPAFVEVLTGVGEEGKPGPGLGRARDKPGVCKEGTERKVSGKRSVPNQSFLLIECLILLMTEFIKVLKERKEFSQFSS